MRHLLPLHYIDTVARSGSIRRAASKLAITSTALNRRILAMEEELGVPIFERLPRGVRLSTAGELLIQHIRSQMADMERVKSQIADLSGARRGHVSIVCGQALLPHFISKQIALYRKEHPAVTFSVKVCDRKAAIEQLTSFDADLSVVFEPFRTAEFQPLSRVEQSLKAIMSASHPLAAKEKLGWSDLLSTKVVLPTASNGMRYILDDAMLRKGDELEKVIESDNFDFIRNYLIHEHCVSFQLPIGLKDDGLEDDGTYHSGSETIEGIADGIEIVSRSIDERAVPGGNLYVAQLKGRVLPVAAALFANAVVKALELRYAIPVEDAQDFKTGTAT